MKIRVMDFILMGLLLSILILGTYSVFRLEYEGVQCVYNPLNYLERQNDYQYECGCFSDLDALQVPAIPPFEIGEINISRLNQTLFTNSS